MSCTTAGYASTKRPLSVFVSYSHKDEGYREELESHLAFLRRNEQISIWNDRKLKPGDDWRRGIDEQLELADIIILLISSDFAASDFCWTVETKRALERHEEGDAIVVPILIRPVDGWNDTPIGRLQALPRDALPVSEWHNRDEAYKNVAAGLRDLIKSTPTEKAYTTPELRDWHLRLEGDPKDYTLSRAESIAEELRKAANAVELELLEVLPGSTKLALRSSQSVFESLNQMHDSGELSARIGEEVIAVEAGTGAVLRIESRIVEGEYRSTIRYLPEMFGGRALEDGFPPLVGGITFPLNNPMQIGFSLLADSAHEIPTSEEQQELQMRLGRYLNTFLVLTGDRVNVTLNPMDDYCGLPKLLRHTELGRDMLAQDVVLKHYTASQLHPTTPHGQVFWEKVNEDASEFGDFESCIRVWIVPGQVTVNEKTVGDHGHVSIEKLGLEVLCEEDYATLRRFRGSKGAPAPEPMEPERTTKAVTLFKEHILPVVQNEVSIGPRFGLLRQVLSVMTVSKWIMESKIGDALKQAGFVDSNEPWKHGLNTVDDTVIQSIKQLYLRMFGAGVWQHTSTKTDPESGLVEKQLYVAGGIELNSSGAPTVEADYNNHSYANS